MIVAAQIKLWIVICKLNQEVLDNVVEMWYLIHPQLLKFNINYTNKTMKHLIICLGSNLTFKKKS